MSQVVADLVVQAHAAAAEAIAYHYRSLLGSHPRDRWGRVVQALDYGYVNDLDERVTPNQPVGFDHVAVSRIFRRRLRPILHGKQMSHHIWEQDEDQGMFSLFGRDPGPGFISPPPRRTRASAIVQQMTRDCRDFRQADKATRTNELSLQVTIPSPLAVAGRLLGDPHSEGSQTYALAALQEWIRELIEDAAEESIDLSYAAVADALTLITNRWKTSKPISADLRNNGSTVVFLCNVLALRGIAAMRVDAGYLSDLAAWSTEAADSADVDPAFSSLPATRAMDARLAGLWLGLRDATVAEFIINPRVTELPSAGEMLNLVDSLPVPFEGGDTIFQGGIRLSPEKSLVATISGEFGSGKTLFGLSLAAALAPLGCRTLFLSCEESPQDITSRLIEAAPKALFRNLPLFKALDVTDFRLRTLNRSSEGPDLGWFAAAQLQIKDVTEAANPSSALETLLRDILNYAEIFKPWSSPDSPPLPRFARPVVIIDGLHQLFDAPETWDVFDSSLRSLIETCRSLGAIFLFSFAKEAEGLDRLEYLCDLIIEVERGGHDDPSDAPYRVFQLLKARRQPARTGAHIFHLKGDAGFRLKPSVDARVQEIKKQMWWSPTEREAIFLTSEPPAGFRPGPRGETASPALSVANHGQILVVGHGSSGKAGFGLYILHRRWFDTTMLVNDRQRRLPMARALADLPKSKQVIAEANLPVRSEAQYLETRVLVISFLYQQTYYDELTNKLSRRRTKTDRPGGGYDNVEALEPMEFAPLPDRLWTDTIELYPGMLSVEDFVAKIEKRLAAAERSGFPYTGVLVDGLHNVFVQFPQLEKDSAFWGMFYNVLRRRRVTVVTTHTEFAINAQGLNPERRRPLSMSYDFDQAERKIAPLLSALISGADYLFDLSPAYESGAPQYLLTPRAMLGDNLGDRTFVWDKQRLQLDALPDVPRTRRSEERDAMALHLGRNLLHLLP